MVWNVGAVWKVRQYDGEKVRLLYRGEDEKEARRIAQTAARKFAALKGCGGQSRRMGTAVVEC